MQATGFILLLAAGVIVLFGGEQTTYQAAPSFAIPISQALIAN